LACQFLALTDHDRPFWRVAHSRAGEAGGTSAARRNGREVLADPSSETGFRLFGQVRYGRYSCPDEAIGSEDLVPRRYAEV
jgi:hypothetical protein